MPGLGSPKDVRHRERVSNASPMGDINEGRSDDHEEEAGGDGGKPSRPSLYDELAIAVKIQLEILRRNLARVTLD